jgi:hypothetical protein
MMGRCGDVAKQSLVAKSEELEIPFAYDAMR